MELQEMLIWIIRLEIGHLQGIRQHQQHQRHQQHQ